MVLNRPEGDGSQKKTPFRSTMNQKDVIVLKLNWRKGRRRCQPVRQSPGIGSCRHDVKKATNTYDLGLGHSLSEAGNTH
jgi:hypothetical protein